MLETFKEVTMMDAYSQNKITVIGHTHPDTDSVCSAIAYAWLKNQTDDAVYEAKCAGSINRETAFALEYFGVPYPRVCEDVYPQLRDIDFRKLPGIDPETSVLEAWNQMRDLDISSLCITSPSQEFLGLISLNGMATANMDLLDASMLSTARTPYRNITKTLKGSLVVGDISSCLTQGRICIGTSPVMIRSTIQPGDLVLTSDQLDLQQCAISYGASCLVLCCGAHPSEKIIAYAEEKQCTIITTGYDTYQAARLINTAIPVRHLMLTSGLELFRTNTPLEEVKKTMARVRFQYFPVLDDNDKYCGVISRRNLLNLKRKQLILVDHNEKSQAVEGLEEAEILEIIDHHRLGAPETDAPVIFRNMPVGCTSTIIYSLFMEKQITPPKEIAGLMLSAILSDTLMFRSPTSTAFDKNAAYALAELAEVSLVEYANRMFEAGSDLTGKTAEDVMFSDFKAFFLGDMKVGIAQTCLMTDKSCADAEALLMPYLETARKKTDVSILFFMLTNTPAESTRILFTGKDAAELLAKAFQKPVSQYFVDLPGVVSRKKQFLPPLKAATRQ